MLLNEKWASPPDSYKFMAVWIFLQMQKIKKNKMEIAFNVNPPKACCKRPVYYTF